MRRKDTAELLATLLGELTRFARSMTSNTDEADEVVQAALTRALQTSSDLRDGRKARAWCFRIARNAYIDLRRGYAARERLVVLGGGLDDLAGVDGQPVELPAIDRVDLERALAQLPEGARMALLLTDLWEFDHKEVAEILEIPVGTVKSRVARARGRLAVILGDHAGTSGRKLG